MLHKGAYKSIIVDDNVDSSNWKLFLCYNFVEHQHKNGIISIKRYFFTGITPILIPIRFPLKDATR